MPLLLLGLKLALVIFESYSTWMLIARFLFQFRTIKQKGAKSNVLKHRQELQKYLQAQNKQEDSGIEDGHSYEEEDDGLDVWGKMFNPRHFYFKVKDLRESFSSLRSPA